MIIIINGSMGVGKSETSWQLIELFEKAIMLDGDHIGAVHPFEIYNEQRIEYLHKTLLHLIKFHQEHGYKHFVINYVFEDSTQLSTLKDSLYTLENDIKSYWLTCEETEHTKRIVGRNNNLEAEMKRYLELNKILRKSSLSGGIGEEINTSNLTAKEVAGEIYHKCT